MAKVGFFWVFCPGHPGNLPKGAQREGRSARHVMDLKLEACSGEFRCSLLMGGISSNEKYDKFVEECHKMLPDPGPFMPGARSINARSQVH